MDLPDKCQLGADDLPAEIHGNLSGKDDLGVALLSLDVLPDGNAEVLGHRTE